VAENLKSFINVLHNHICIARILSTTTTATAKPMLLATALRMWYAVKQWGIYPHYHRLNIWRICFIPNQER
jgi:hypothetical protein